MVESALSTSEGHTHAALDRISSAACKEEGKEDEKADVILIVDQDLERKSYPR
jgi:hypothetical protein